MKKDPIDRTRDLTLSRTIKAPRQDVWDAWTDPEKFERWWIPSPASCRVRAMELKPGGAFITEIGENGKHFAPHLDACFLAIEEGHRIVFTNALTGGWRPSAQSFMTASISFADHELGTTYSAHVMHENEANRTMHEKMGFFDGWGMVAAQLAALVEKPD